MPDRAHHSRTGHEPTFRNAGLSDVSNSEGMGKVGQTCMSMADAI